MSESTNGPIGAMTALVTPMNADGSVDFGALDALVDMQIEGGIDGLVPCGTTGESATMTADERQSVISHVVKRVNGRVPVVAGAGHKAGVFAATALHHGSGLAKRGGRVSCRPDRPDSSWDLGASAAGWLPLD